MLGTFNDDRADVVGATFTIDAERFNALCTRAVIAPEIVVNVTLVPLDVEVPDAHGAFRPITEDFKSWEIQVPISDRFEFSDKALARINRNVLHVLRHVSQVSLFAEYFGEEGGPLATAMVGPVLEVDAYRCERSIKDAAETFCLSPQAVALADEPQTKDGK